MFEVVQFRRWLSFAQILFSVLVFSACNAFKLIFVPTILGAFQKNVIGKSDNHGAQQVHEWKSDNPEPRRNVCIQPNHKILR